MNYQEYISDATKKSAAELFRYGKAVPDDKLEWKPMDEGRSVLDQLRECAKGPDWAVLLVTNEKMPDWSDKAAQEQMHAEMNAWATVDECLAACNERLEKMAATFKDVPDEKLTETKWLPFDGGRDFTIQEIMDYPRWNFNYHLGQISYIQIMYGDKEMH